MPDYADLKSHNQFVALTDMYLHAKNQLCNSNSYSSLKILQSDWPRAFLYLTPEPDFSQTCGFNRIIKSTHRWTIFLQNPKNPIFGMFFGIIPK